MNSRHSQLRSQSTIVLILVGISLIFLIAYTLFHEGGHALVGALFGARITSLSLSFWDLTAHVGMTDNEHFSVFQHALTSLAGVSLPILAWMIALTLLPRKGNIFLDWFKLLGSMSVFSPLLVWIVIPILSIFGKPP
ncbi:MAG TPA: M50 family metallopeptidase, partial [Anaerolineaceae bacterium]|nr:M50 family metallopeptidase [Anaerolineaceae bacterium]